MSPPFDDVPWDQLAAHLAGALSPAEEQQLQAWLRQNPAREDLLASLRTVWTGSARVRLAWDDPEAMLAAIKAEGIEPVKVLRLEARVSARVRPLRQALVAAGLAALLVGGWWLMRSARVSDSSPAAAAFQEFRAQRGQRLALRLPDGSAVMLGPTSALRFPKAYGTRDRVVELEGEGYFNVTHDAARPFTVRTRHLSVHDLGTRFVIRAYDPDSTTRVVVAEGKVALGAGPVLAPGQLAVASASGAITVRRRVNPERYLAWTEGRLVFEAARLADVVTELNRWYDVDIRLAGRGVGDRLLTAQFRDDPITKVLSLIGASLDLAVSGSGRDFTLGAEPQAAGRKP